MRGAFVRTLVELADRDRRIALLTGDLGYMALEPFMERHADRFFNIGVAEQNMVGIATGLAEAGFVRSSTRSSRSRRSGRTSSSATAPCGTACPSASSASAAASSTARRASRTTASRTSASCACSRHDGRRAGRPRADGDALRATWNVRAGLLPHRQGRQDGRARLDGRFRPGRAEIVREGATLRSSPWARSRARRRAAATLAERLRDARDRRRERAARAGRRSARGARRRAARCHVEAHYASGGLGSLAREVIAEHGSVPARPRRGARAADARVGSQSYMHALHGSRRPRSSTTVLEQLGRRA
jgi:transketolase